MSLPGTPIGGSEPVGQYQSIKASVPENRYLLMACPFSAFYSQKDSSNGAAAEGIGRKSPTEQRLEEASSVAPSRKTSLGQPEPKFQHQVSITGGGEVETRAIRRETPPSRIVWERGPSLDHLKAANGVGVVQQRVHSFTQQLEKSVALSQHGINRSVSSSAVGDAPLRERRPRQPMGEREQRPLLRNPRKPPDPRDHLSLKNLTEAVWSFVTIPVRGRNDG